MSSWGGEWSYARALIRAGLSTLSQGYDGDEIVFYGDDTLLGDEECQRLALAPVLSAPARGMTYTGADRYFRALPNGARCRVLFRSLPTTTLTQLDGGFDIFLLSYYTWLDDVDVLHVVSGQTVPLTRAPVVLTLHHLPKSKRDKFSRFAKVVTTSPEVSTELREEHGVDQSRLVNAPLGVETVFEAIVPELEREDERALGIDGRTIEPGFTLLFASLEKQYNLKRAIAAWSALDEELQQKGLVIVVHSEQMRTVVRFMLKGNKQRDVVHLIRLERRQHLPYLFKQAGVVLAPYLSVGTHFEACDAAAVQTPIVRGVAPTEVDGSLSFLCVPESVESIREQLAEALGSVGQLESQKKTKKTSRTLASAVRNATLDPPKHTMRQHFVELFSVYKELNLRYKGLKSSI